MYQKVLNKLTGSFKQIGRKFWNFWKSNFLPNFARNWFDFTSKFYKLFNFYWFSIGVKFKRKAERWRKNIFSNVPLKPTSGGTFLNLSDNLHWTSFCFCDSFGTLCSYINSNFFHNNIYPLNPQVSKSQAFDVSMPLTSTAKCENHESGAAPCQCLTLAGIFITSPSFISIGSLHHSW